MNVRMLALALSAVMYVLPVQAFAQRTLPGPATVNPIRPGYIGMVRLEDLAPENLRPACQLLLQKKLSEAAVVLRAALQRDPSADAAYVGLCQSDTAFLASEARRLRGSRPTTADQRFRTGTALYLEWGATTPIGRRFGDYIQELDPFRTLLREAWQESHDILAGNMYIDAMLVTPERKDPLLAVTLEMIKGLATPDGWKEYMNVRARGEWKSNPPPLSAVDPTHRHALFAVLGQHWSLLTYTYDVKKPSGSWTRLPVAPRKAAEADYVHRWWYLLRQSLSS